MRTFFDIEDFAQQFSAARPGQSGLRILAVSEYAGHLADPGKTAY